MEQILLIALSVTQYIKALLLVRFTEKEEPISNGGNEFTLT